MRALGLIVWIAALGPSAWAQAPVVVTDQTRAYIVGPADLILGPHVSAARWSFDGRYVLLTHEKLTVTEGDVASAAAGRPMRSAPRSEKALMLVDAVTRKAERIWSGDGALRPNSDYGWLTGSHVAVVVAGALDGSQGARQRILLVDARAARPRTLMEADDRSLLGLDFDALTPRVLVRRTALASEQRPRNRWVIVNRAGRQRQVEPTTPAGPADYVTWSHDGRLSARTRLAADGQQAKAAVRWWSVDPETGAAREIERPPAPVRVERPSALKVAATDQAVQSGEARATVRLLWLESGGPQGPDRSLLCADGDWGQVSPDLKHILWSARGAAWIAQVTPVPLDRYREMRDEAQRVAAMSRGKQAALATMMYVQDHDEVLPSPEQMPAAVLPYLKDAAVIEGFVYALQGGKMGDYRSPATTPMGHIPGPGGRAVAYLDGHVEWTKE